MSENKIEIEGARVHNLKKRGCDTATLQLERGYRA